ncbi:hypothetical protein K2173_005907 [Erythroxylum novogranatense]|uniref:PB1 domain-containing protein n=1 Tax=Erythroxylum novogranatense TaxID=1862640 RepID=A0AAV8U302_9ROSI|nr:hypothetical protein K2173_005907 [Erythroxylum novogranatense]
MVGPSLYTTELHPKLVATATTIKFLCSYGGKITPRYPDCNLRYHGGITRVLVVDRSTPFSKLLLKLGELCGASVTLRCQLPAEDLDALVSITSDEDLVNLIEEYDRAMKPKGSLKIRAFLSLPKKNYPPPPHPPSFPIGLSKSSSSSSSTSSNDQCVYVASNSTSRSQYQFSSTPVVYPVKIVPHYGYHFHGNPTYMYLVHNGNHWRKQCLN